MTKLFMDKVILFAGKFRDSFVKYEEGNMTSNCL